MKRRAFFRDSAAGGLGLWAAAPLASGQETPGVSPAAAAAEMPLVLSPPVVMAPRPDGVEIIWAVSALATGRVEFGGTAELGQAAHSTPWGFTPQGTKVLRVRLEGLKPGTAYHFRSVTERAGKTPETHQSELRSFRTLDPAAASTSFTVWNDTHRHEETIRKLLEVTPAADFNLWNGDTCNDWMTPDLFIPTLLAPAGGAEITARSPLLVTRGNHDVRGPYAFEFSDYIAMPSGRPFYSFRSGPVAFLCLDTGEDKDDDHPSFQGRAAFEPLRREQAAWIEQEIKRPEIGQAPYRVVFCHLPLRWLDETPTTDYDRFSLRSRKLWHDALVRWGAQVIISGHTHHAAMILGNNEFPYAQITGGGPQLAGATLITGEADATSLRLKTLRLGDGSEKNTLVLMPLG